MSRLKPSSASAGEPCCWLKLSHRSIKALSSLFLFFLCIGQASAQVTNCSLNFDCPDDITVECGTNINDLTITGAVVITNQGSCQYQVTYTDAVLPGGTDCLKTISRTFTVTVIGGSSGTCTQLITVEDTMPPVIPGFQESLTFQCEGEIPPISNCVATDCNDVVLCNSFQSCTGCDTLNCNLSLALGVGLDWSVWLAGLTSQGLASNDYYRWVPGTAYMSLNDDGTAHVYGEVVNVSNPNEGWICHFWLKNGRNWSQWSALGRSYKDDLNIAAASHVFWTYYELVGGFSHLVGTGDNAGSWLSLTHMPSSYYFGFQCGQGANNRNGNMGLSGWFYYSGQIEQDGETTNVSGHGDLTTDKVCSSSSETCEQEITRLYRAKDECGNEQVYTQVITIEDTTPPMLNCPEDITVECHLPIPGPVDPSELEASDNCDDDLLVELFDAGELIVDDACHSHITYVYYAEDDCQNRTFCEYTVYIVDTTAPDLVVPDDATFECDEEIVYAPATATDLCQQNVTVTEGEPYIMSGDCPQEYTIIRYFTADDGCGNIAYGSQTINIVDTTAPVFEDFPVQVWVECDEVDEVPIPTATDNCDELVEVTYTSETGSGGCLGVVVRYLVATDDCGNTAEAEQYIHIMDTTPPVINEPEDMTVECDEVPEAPGEAGADIYDNCGHEVEVEFHTEIQEGPCEDSYTILWIWDAMDICENWSHDTTVITVVDNTDPILYLGYGGSYSCEETIVYDVPSAEDNCDDNVDITTEIDTIEGDCPYSYTIVHYFVATDNCGNTATGSISYIVYDNTPPTFTSVPEDITIECDEEVPASEAMAEDNCGMTTVTQSDELYYQSACYSHIIRTFVATDECNNSSTAVQNIYIYDTEAPVITGDEEIEIPCEQFDLNEGIYVEATDNCNEYTIYIDSTLQVSGECAGVYMRYYSAWDVCENQSETFIQIISLTDDTPPVGTEPADISVLCSDPIPSFDPMFTDNCGYPVNVVYQGFEVTNVCNATYTETWTATDNCGNVTVIDRNVTIYDNVNPYFYSFPPNLTIDCHDPMPEVVYPIAYDNCDTDVTVELTTVVMPGDCPQEYTVYRTFRGFDNCGNQVVQNQVITVVDDEAPVFDDENQTDFEYECDEEAELIQPTATDNCGEITYSYVDTLFYEEECYEAFYRVWTAADECGNSSTFWQYIYFIDTTPPVISGDPAIEIACEEFNINEGVFVTAEDNCNDVWIVIDSTFQVSGNCAGVYLRYYTAYDNCENASDQFLQIITVIDETAPTVDAEPMDMTYECDENWVPASPVFSDNCDDALDVVSNVVIEEDECTVIYHYTWTATDNCDNSTMVDQVITITDTTDPVVYWSPGNQTYECGEEWYIEEPMFFDNCDNELTITSQESEQMVECNLVYTYSWTATDNCGNSVTETITVTVVDTTPPTIDAPEDSEFSCDEEIDYGMPVYSDVCDDMVEITFVDQIIPGDCPQSYTIIRTWYATDDCLNTSSDVTEYNVYDTEAPYFTSVPDDITVECDEEIPSSSATAEDNCGLVTVTYTDSELMQDECNGYIIRTFVAEDECGNTTTYEQTIDIIDTTPPVLIMPEPNEASIPCQQVFYAYYAIWANGQATPQQIAAAQALFAQLGLLPVGVDDNCDENAYWLETGIDVSLDVECPNVAVITCTFTPYDNCGNVGESMESYIYVVDETAPVLVNPIADEYIECDEDDMGWQPIFDDECNDNITVIPSSSITTDGCTTTIQKTWTAADPCGNETVVTHNIIITDNTDPVVIAPYDMTYSCHEDFDFGNPTITDNCDTELDIEITNDTIDGNCPAEKIIIRTWTATDNCGNVGSDSATITVVDNEDPYFTEVPDDITIECDQPLPVADASAEDLCSEVEVTHSDEWYYESPCYSILYRTYVATDECGNSTEHVQIITVEDTTPPVISGPLSIYIPCEEFDMNEGVFVTASDNCNEYTIVIEETQQVSGECAGVYMRTYVAYDECQNASEPFLQIIHLTDDTPPVGNEPQDITISCDEVAPPFDPQWTDNCNGELIFSHTSPTVSGYCNVSYTETWTATDGCGNQASVDRIVTIVDEESPIIMAEDLEVTIDCDENYEFVTPYASDNCDMDVQVIGVLTTEDGDCPGEYTEIMVYTAYDECGNTSSVTITVHHIDDEAPVLSNLPENQYHECDDTWSVVPPTASDNCSDVTLISNMYVEEGDCPNNYTEVYSWYAQDECGNMSDTYYAYVYVTDQTDPTFDNMPTDESYECIDWETYEVQVVTASDNCGDATVTYAIEEEESDDCGNGIWVVHYTATDLCGNTATTDYTISVYDETEPVLSAYPTDLVIDCNDEIPAAPQITATDNCDVVQVVYSGDMCYGECPEEGEDNQCDMVRPNLITNECNYNCAGNPAPWSLALFSLGNNNFRYYLLDEDYAGNSFVVNGDGTIDVTCRVISCYDETGGFDINVSFQNEMTWEEWSTQSFPTSFKADCEGEAANHEDWLYYLLSNTPGAEIIGWGSLAGSSLSLMHAPANNYFGFQYGDGANNLSGGFGLGGWFTYSGTFLYNGQPINNGNGAVSGAGDLAWELDCCPDYYIVRCWSATDCTGNTVEWCQTISFADLDAGIGGITQQPEPSQAPGGINIVSIQPNPANEKSIISFTSEMEGKLSLQVMDMTGRIVADLFNNNVEAGLVYKAEFNAVTLESGMYMIRLSNSTEQKVERIQVIR